MEEKKALSLAGVVRFSRRKREARPVAETSRPKIRKNSFQRPCWVMPSKRPKMTSMEISGRVERTASTRPRLVPSVTSVT